MYKRNLEYNIYYKGLLNTLTEKGGIENERFTLHTYRLW